MLKKIAVKFVIFEFFFFFPHPKWNKSANFYLFVTSYTLEVSSISSKMTWLDMWEENWRKCYILEVEGLGVSQPIVLYTKCRQSREISHILFEYAFMTGEKKIVTVTIHLLIRQHSAPSFLIYVHFKLATESLCIMWFSIA